MLRALAVPVACSDAAFLQRLTRLGLTKEEAVDIFRDVQDPGRFNSAYISAHGASIVESIVRNSWVSVDCVKGVVRPESGTLAGTSLTDLFFIVAFAKVVAKFDQACLEQKLLTKFDCRTAAAYYGISDIPVYVDSGSFVYMDVLYRPIFVARRT